MEGKYGGTQMGTLALGINKNHRTLTMRSTPLF
ncbi:hypothetical protein T09_14636 [Trichinella sp. T9]|nr:hypothetical protein T09_7904 [Trichinella sp. T9]KRX43744.1 hypothetical protein T09_14636 [Trichinella sp. T9]